VTADTAFDTYLAAKGVALDDSDVTLLEAVDDRGSLNRAATDLGRSYARVQRRVVELEEAFGPLVERTRGGAGGGGSRLTDEARDLLARFERMRAAASGVAEAGETVLSGTVRDREGELATVETDAGTVRALVPPDAELVELSIRSDAVTLAAPDAAPEPADTSARNRFEGAVREVAAGETIARVQVDVGADEPLAALVTLASVETLDLGVGDSVVTSFKATATRGVGVE
jgi:molybdate transport system regulatory protein